MFDKKAAEEKKPIEFPISPELKVLQERFATVTTTLTQTEADIFRRTQDRVGLLNQKKILEDTIKTIVANAKIPAKPSKPETNKS